jgi:enoyl-CoA hydratase/carnithine racemase
VTDHIIIERPVEHPGIVVVRMNRPDKKNAITRDMYGAMALALADADADDSVRCLVLFGVPGCFSSGNDLSDFIQIAAEQSEAKNVVAFLHELARFSKPLLSGVDGVAIGVGVTMNLHCDLTFATPRSVFKTPFTDLAVVPEAGSSLLAPQIMGYQRAFAMLALGVPFTSEEARAAGIIFKIVSEEALESAVLATASALAAKPRDALLLSRKLMRGDVDHLRDHMDAEMKHFLAQLRSKEAAGVYSAFFARKG